MTCNYVYTSTYIGVVPVVTFTVTKQTDPLLVFSFCFCILYFVTLPNVLNNGKVVVVETPVYFITDPQHDSLPLPYLY